MFSRYWKDPSRESKVLLESGNHVLLYNDQRGISQGEVFRYIIKVDKAQLDAKTKIEELVLRIKNVESPLLRPIYLTGPYSVYAEVRPYNYDENTAFQGDDLQFISDLKPDEAFSATLKLNGDSQVGESTVYSWTVDVLSQMTLMVDHPILVRLSIGNTRSIVKAAMKTPARAVEPVSGFTVEIQDTMTVWNEPPLFPERPVHLVIVTHGIFSNIGCDMLYLRDRLKKCADAVEENCNQNVVVRGYHGNIGKSHKGIEYLAMRVADYVLKTIAQMRNEYVLDRISFIGHSLGGLVQTFAIQYMLERDPGIFSPQAGGLRPMNFIALASPFLGVIGDFPLYATVALNFGALGRTGKDLNLKNDFAISELVRNPKQAYNRRPVLESIVSGSMKSVLQAFSNRTLYANALHDGIVPLRTSALLYLDWYSLQEVNLIGAQEGAETFDLGEEDHALKRYDTVEIPPDLSEKKDTIRWLLPRALIKRRHKWYKRSQTVKPGIEQLWDEDSDYHPLTKASALSSAANILVAPPPTQDYYKDPQSRTDYIFHDKRYSPEELPPAYYRNRELLKKILYPNDKVHRTQEKIARGYQESMSWRKVLVNIQPESHNNIIVRRRFVNSFGWIVIEHLVNEHFGRRASRSD
ncbi:AER322Cp [Eremothecium gossypii ATCC 10895]|uniref:AER322Cp n=1 Tax=Eremothecium gossypii (strain ATCC 10895 / CBS 109.51 / FGSC 9923 / NRRL Y-1056) TaxID=284811 RepID=Q756E3_EREGS|nr:AER322Cp [Eremothecium gossypii ATCC 10895]AAS53002.2 AER322Cp [Eremothecium gossypii ATCC 10895]